VAILFIVSILLFFLTADLVVAKLQYRRFHRAMGARVEEDAKGWHIQAVDEGLLVHPFHTWMAKGSDGTFRLGTDGFANAILGGLDRAVPCVTKGSIKEGAPLAVLSAQGRSITLFSPIDGEVLGSNEALTAKAVAEDPLGRGWLLEVRPARVPVAGSTWRGKESLRRWWREEFLRLRENALSAAAHEDAVGVSMADGGALRPGAFTQLDPVTFTDLLHSTFGARAAEPSPAPIALVTEGAST
jgi:glycine cleavage system H lipoate-binding protein